MASFNNYAGQLVASGIRPNEPVMAFEDTGSAALLANTQMFGNLLPKIAKTLIRETRIRANPIDVHFKKSSLPFGVGFEEFQFTEGAMNKKNDGRCFPFGNVPGDSQLNLLNFAWSYDINIYDREINKAVLTPEEAGSFSAQKMRTMYKGYASQKYSAELQLLSDVIDGTRSVSSTTQSDGQGTSVTYNPTITGYAGEVEDSQIVLAPLVQGTIPTFASAQDALDLVKALQNAVTEMYEEDTTYSKMGISTFLLSKPLVFMESKTLNAIDNAWAMDGTYKGIPTKTAREFIGSFGQLVEIPGQGFASLPTNANYTNKRLFAVAIDRDSLSENVLWENVEGQRCSKQRSTNYNYAGASTLSIYRGNPAYALLVNTQ